MMYTIINANHDDPDIDVSVSEIVYQIESRGIDTTQIRLQKLKDPISCHQVQDMTSRSDLVLYICPLDVKKAMNRLTTFLDKYPSTEHPPIYVIIHGKRLLSVDEVENIMTTFEVFAQKHKSKIVDVAYLKDALEALSGQ